MPFTESLFGRISVGSFNQDGYVKREFDGSELDDDDTLSGRAALRWIATDALEINLSADVTRDRESGAPYVISAIQYDNFNSFVTLNNVLATGDPFSCYAPEQLAREAMRLAGHKLPVKTKFVMREGAGQQ